MVGHEQAGHDFTVHNVPFHDFRHVGIGFHTVPDTFRVNHHAGTECAMVETAGLVRAHDVLEIQTLCLLLETVMERLRSKLGATPSGVVRTSLVDADENMSFESGQGSPTIRPASWSFGTGRSVASHRRPSIKWIGLTTRSGL